MIYPKVIYKNFTYNPNVFKVRKDPLFPALLFYLKSFVRIRMAYPIFADPFFIQRFEKTIVFRHGLLHLVVLTIGHRTIYIAL